MIGGPTQGVDGQQILVFVQVDQGTQIDKVIPGPGEDLGDGFRHIAVGFR